MVGRGSFRAVAVTLGALVVLLLQTLPVLGADDCTVSVSPRAGAAGSVFTFKGSGFVPTVLLLQKGGADAGSHSIDVDGDDPWQVTVRSRPGDEGEWSAALSSDDCSAVARFTVTLANTDAATDAAASSSSQGMPSLGLVALVLGASAAAGVALGRHLRPQAR